MTLAYEAVTVDEFESLERALPEEFTAELINGRVIVVPAPVGDHMENLIAIADQIHSARSEFRLYPEAGLAIGGYREGRARADGAVARRGYFRGQESWADPSGVQLVLEITSGRDQDADVDRIEKRDAYAATGIPIYLLVDRHQKQVVVHWAPAGGRYTHSASVTFGERLPLPEPFSFELDTSELA